MREIALEPAKTLVEVCDALRLGEERTCAMSPESLQALA